MASLCQCPGNGVWEICASPVPVCISPLLLSRILLYGRAVYAFTHWRTFGLFPCVSNCVWSCHKYLCRDFCGNLSFRPSWVNTRRGVCQLSGNYYNFIWNCSVRLQSGRSIWFPECICERSSYPTDSPALSLVFPWRPCWRSGCCLVTWLSNDWCYWAPYKVSFLLKVGSSPYPHRAASLGLLC